MWKPKGEFKVVSLGCEFLLVKFTTTTDKEVVLRDGPWTVLGHYLFGS